MKTSYEITDHDRNSAADLTSEHQKVDVHQIQMTSKKMSWTGFKKEEDVVENRVLQEIIDNDETRPISNGKSRKKVEPEKWRAREFRVPDAVFTGKTRHLPSPYTYFKRYISDDLFQMMAD
nr:unnamed protein product [Callosobruchus analis]